MSVSTDRESQGYGSIPVSEERDPKELQDLEAAFVGEAFGSFLYVQMGCAASCIAAYGNTYHKDTQWLGCAVVWAVALTLGIYIASPMSGGHLNPAVSWSFALVRPGDFEFTPKLLPYVLAQLIGAMTAGFFNLLLFHKMIGNFEEKNEIVRGEFDSYQSAIGFGNYFSLNADEVRNGVHAFFIEAFGTGILVFIIFALTSRKNRIPGAAIPPLVGASLGVLSIVFGPLTGASFNPARDMGPRLVLAAARWKMAAFHDCLPYLFGPLVGGPVGAFFADKVLYMNEYIQ